MAQLKITLKKSLIGRQKDQIATAKSLGLKKPGNIAIQPDNVQNRLKCHRQRCCQWRRDRGQG